MAPETREREPATAVRRRHERQRESTADGAGHRRHRLSRARTSCDELVDARATACACWRAARRRRSTELGVELAAATWSRDARRRATPLARARSTACRRVFHLAGLVSRDPDDGQRMMRLHVDGTRRVLEAAAAAGVRRVVLASTSGTIAVSQRRRADPRRARALRRRDRRAAGPTTSRRSTRRSWRSSTARTLGHRGRRRQPDAAARARRRAQLVDGRRAQVPEARDPGRARRRHQLRRRARRGRGDRRPRSSSGRAGRALPARRPQLDLRRILRAARARRRTCAAPRLKLPTKLARRAARRCSSRPTQALDDEPPVERISVEMAEHLLVVRLVARRSPSSASSRAIRARRSTTPSAICARA